MALDISLAYARYGDVYLPVAVARFADVLSGQEILVPLTVGSADSDLDGELDSSGNCVEDPNRDQRDSDGDGIGDVCDVALVTTKQLTKSLLTALVTVGDLPRAC